MNHLNQSSKSSYHPLSVPYNYKHSGKELQETGMYDFGWRHYMPDIGRWNGMDQLAEKYFSTSPYAYVANNPVSFRDPDGRDIDPIEGGWKFTGSDINLVLSYFGANGDFGNLVGQLEDYGNDFGSGPISTFWNTFNSGGIIGGVSVRNGWLTWSTNYGENGNGILQGLQMNSTKVNQEKFNGWMKGENSDSSNNFWMNDDEYLTFEEAIWHYRFGKGRPVDVRADKLDLSSIRVSDFENPDWIYQGNPAKTVRLSSLDNLFTGNRYEALVFGTVDVVYIGGNKVMILPNEYNFEMHGEKTLRGVSRDIATAIGGGYNSFGLGGQDYWIQFIGTATIQP